MFLCGTSSVYTVLVGSSFCMRGSYNFFSYHRGEGPINH